ncbi:MAG TPA: helix-turn-helix domain-containing protein [Nitrospiraceae bacterium]|nr:helix-turn-helix domain-containing protein [Nitrospiraceae bacterium]
MEFLTVKETAQLVRVSPITVRRYIASGQLAAERVGRGIRVRREAIEEFVSPVVRSTTKGQIVGSDKPSTILEGMGISVGTFRSGMPTDIARHKDEYVADAIADWDLDNEDEKLVEVVSPSSPGGVEHVPDHLVGKPNTKDDSLWDIIGIGRSDGPNDVASNKHEYLANAIFADKFSRG